MFMAVKNKYINIAIILAMLIPEGGYAYQCIRNGLEKDYDLEKNIFSVKIDTISEGQLLGEVIENFKGKTKNKISIKGLSQVDGWVRFGRRFTAEQCPCVLVPLRRTGMVVAIWRARP